MLNFEYAKPYFSRELLSFFSLVLLVKCPAFSMKQLLFCDSCQSGFPAIVMQIGWFTLHYTGHEKPEEQACRPELGCFPISEGRLEIVEL